MTASTLVLVDFDNLAREVDGGLPFPVRSPRETAAWLEARPAHEWPTADELLSRGAEEAPAGRPNCTVAVAMNALTATTWGLRWGYLRSLAQALGQCLVGAAQVGLETVLTLPVPQTADAALLRLCLETPDPSAAGSVFEVWLLSRDRGLARTLGEQLESSDLSHDASARHGVHRWVSIAGGHGCVRRFERGIGAVAPPTPPLEPRFSVDIDTPGLAAWAASRGVDLGPDERDLGDVARAVVARPGVLSQLGMTSATVRGVGRMAALPEHAEIGACQPTDGLEVRMAGPPAAQQAGQVRPSSVGPGAVRLVDLGATMATDVPYGALDALVSQPGGRVRVASDGTGVDDRQVLRDLPEGVGLGAPCRVLLRTRRFEEEPMLTAEVRAEGLRTPVAWWHSRRARQSASRKCRVLAEWLSSGTSFEVCARLRRVTLSGVPTLVLGSAAARGVRARVDTPIDHRQIGAAWLEGEEPIAAVAGRQRLRPGWHTVSPIQDFGDPRLKQQLGASAAEREALLELPVVLKEPAP